MMETIFNASKHKLCTDLNNFDFQKPYFELLNLFLALFFIGIAAQC